jgi:hypothetical protein
MVRVQAPSWPGSPPLSPKEGKTGRGEGWGVVADVDHLATSPRREEGLHTPPED